MKKSFGIGDVYLEIETEDERSEYASTIKNRGYEFNPIKNAYTYTSGEELIFLERGIKNKIGLNFLTLKAGLNSGVYRKKDIPLVVNETIFINNNEIKAGNSFLLIEERKGVNISYNNRYNYRINGTTEFMKNVIENNYIGIRCDVDVGIFKKNESMECNFELQIDNKNFRMKMVVKDVR